MKENTITLQLYICVGDSDVPLKPCLKDENELMNDHRLILSPSMLTIIMHSLATAYQTSKGHTVYERTAIQLAKILSSRQLLPPYLMMIKLPILAIDGSLYFFN